MTREGFEELEAELDHLKLVKRAEIVERIKVARSYGDLSENSEYEAAKDEQAFVEGRINTLQNMLDNAIIIDSSEIADDEVSVGKKVTFKELPDEDPETYAIVGAVEANPLEGKISNESPIAVALMGKKVGDQVEVPLPNGASMEVEIIAVEVA